MSRRDPQVPLLHMRDHAREALDFAAGRKREDLDTDRMLCLALVRLVEVIGEAAARVPEEVRSQCSQIPWQQIVAMRNRLIHAYDQISLERLWEVVSKDLPALVVELDRAIGTLKK